jgi:ferritin
MLKNTIENALNDQIDKEIASSHLYLSMAAHFEHEKLPGFAQWLKVQAREEMGHAMKLFEYVIARGGRVVLGGIDAPPAQFGAATEVFEQILEHERLVTKSIHELFELAMQEKDYASQAHLQWFITEQVEEEKSAEEILDKLKMIEANPGLLLMFDAQLGGRK